MTRAEFFKHLHELTWRHHSALKQIEGSKNALTRLKDPAKVAVEQERLKLSESVRLTREADIVNFLRTYHDHITLTEN